MAEQLGSELEVCRRRVGEVVEKLRAVVLWYLEDRKWHSPEEVWL
jgi:hypothetical protein